MKLSKGRISSDLARRNWRDVLDYVQHGDSLIITRAGKPVGVMIPFEDWQVVKDRLEDLDDVRTFRKKHEAYGRDVAAGTVERDPVWDRLLAEEDEGKKKHI